MKSIKLKITVNAPANEVYRAFTNSTALREWFCNAAQADAKKGGRLYASWNDGYYASGEYTALSPTQVAWKWQGRGEPSETRVRINIAEKNDASVVTLAHSGIGTSRVWARASKTFERDWGSALVNLKSVLETGQDLRFTRRPMLGIFAGSFNAEEAKTLKVPVTQGVRLDSTAEGLGARQAGLQKDDVIVQMGKQKITGFGSLPQVLQHHRAGEKIPVVFYRDGEKKTVTMELSARKLPDIPATARGLGDAVRKLNDPLNRELDPVMNGVSEAEASFKPSPQDWSAKETLAHLILGERQNTFQLYDLMFDAERAYDSVDNLDNLPLQMSAIAQAYTAVELVQELKHNQAETVAMLSALPESFVAHKGTYWRLAFGLLQPLDHQRGHFKQMRDAINAARKK